ncbi:MAG TPA: PEP-CTERM sorting domain-containing protein [Anaerohalosphaeraceae bacterium]|nr:PEP-CTERM sorting domain-containing protein [Anaerohalosphaeraceae bacterium]
MKKFCLLLLLCAWVGPSFAAILMSDNFDSYTNGNLVGQGGWAAHSGAGNAPVQVVNGTVKLITQSTSAEDVNKSVGATMGSGDIWYAGLDVIVGSASTGKDYFAHFLQGTSNFAARVGVDMASGGKFAFGLFGVSAYPGALTGYVYDVEQTYRVVTSYNFTTGLCTMWVNGTEVLTQNWYTSNANTAYAFRQGTSGSLRLTVDNLVVATTYAEAAVPEPATMALLGLGGLLAVVRRK